jgi:tetratricopeptide (TPR) repeat protein
LQFESGDLLGVSSNAVRPGDSGGPLLNEEGEVIGVVSSGRSTNRERDVLREDLCLAADPRRALAVRIVRDEPVSLRDALREAARDAPNGEVLQAASMLMMRGQATRNAGDHLAQIAAAAQRAPNDAALQFLAGSVFQAVGDDERAEASYLAALNGLSDYFPALYALGHMYYQRGEYEEAEDLFERTRSFAPYARLGALGLARVYTARLHYTAAAEALAVVLDHNPAYAPALYLLGYGHLAQGRIQEAEAIAVRLDRIDSGWADALRIHISVPLLRPAAVRPLPRAEIPANSED